MPNRPICSKGASKRDALLETILAAKPSGGENFHVFSIVTDGDEPTWDKRQTFFGNYEEAAAHCVRALGAMAEANQLQKGAQIECYQGQNARDYLRACAIQERRYRQERQSQANN